MQVDRLTVAVALSVAIAALWFTPVAPLVRTQLRARRLGARRPGAEHDDGQHEPQWKRGLLILAGLYPLVVVHDALFSRHLEQLGRANALLLATVVTVGLLGWPVLPGLRRAMAWWLHGDRSGATLLDGAGIALLVGVIAATAGVSSVLS